MVVGEKIRLKPKISFKELLVSKLEEIDQAKEEDRELFKELLPSLIAFLPKDHQRSAFSILQKGDAEGCFEYIVCYFESIGLIRRTTLDVWGPEGQEPTRKTFYL